MNSKMFNINTILRDGVERDVDRKGESIMEMSEKLMELHSKGYNCGQIICAVLGEELGWDQSTPEALADMCESCGQICGTLRGGDFCINKFIREKTAAEAGIPVEKVYDDLPADAQMKMMMDAREFVIELKQSTFKREKINYAKTGNARMKS